MADEAHWCGNCNDDRELRKLIEPITMSELRDACFSVAQEMVDDGALLYYDDFPLDRIFFYLKNQQLNRRQRTCTNENCFENCVLKGGSGEPVRCQFAGRDDNGWFVVGGVQS